MIRSKPATRESRKNHDRIFKKRKSDIDKFIKLQNEFKTVIVVNNDLNFTGD